MRPHSSAGAVPVSRRIMENAAGYFERLPDPDLGTTIPHCFDRDDGKHFCMAHQSLVGSKGGLILLMIEAEKGGLFIEMTPAGIRQFCGDLLGVADKIEAKHVKPATHSLPPRWRANPAPRLIDRNLIIPGPIRRCPDLPPERPVFHA